MMGVVWSQQKTIQNSHQEILRLKNQVKNQGVEAQEDRDAREALQQKIEVLEQAKAELDTKLQQASKSSDSTQAEIESLRESLEKARAEEVAQVRSELQAKHQVEVEGLKKSLEAAEGNKDSMDQLEEQNKKLAEQAAECSALEQQLAKLSQQLEDEQASKKVSSKPHLPREMISRTFSPFRRF